MRPDVVGCAAFGLVQHLQSRQRASMRHRQRIRLLRTAHEAGLELSVMSDRPVRHRTRLRPCSDPTV